MADEQPATESADASESPTPPVRRGGRRRARATTAGTGPVRRHPVAVVVTSALVLVALLTSTAVTLVYRDLDGNVKENAFTPTFGDGYTAPTKKQFPDAEHEPLNILIMGSDSRDCDGCHIDKEGGGGSDTTILVHLSRDRKHAYGISIPRDTIIDRPACANAQGEQFPAESGVMWNAGFALAGPGCTIEQVESVSNIPIDDSIVVNFEGFKDMVDAVGGVQVCVPQEIDDREHGIVIPAGTRTISGNQALSYVRVRHGVGDGSDISRIKRQQAFIASLTHAVLSARTLSSPLKVYKFLKAATKNLQFDDKVDSLSQLASLGSGFKDIGLDNIKFFTIPFENDPADPNRVIFAPQAEDVWKRLRKDKTIPPSLTDGAINVGHVPGQNTKPGKNSADNSQLAYAGLCTL